MLKKYNRLELRNSLAEFFWSGKIDKTDSLVFEYKIYFTGGFIG